MQRDSSLNEYIKKPLTSAELEDFNKNIKPELINLEKRELSMIYRIGGVSFLAAIGLLYGLNHMDTFPMVGAILLSVILGFFIFLGLALPASHKLSAKAKSLASLKINGESINLQRNLGVAKVNENAIPQYGKAKQLFDNIRANGRDPVRFERILIKELVLADIGGKDQIIVAEGA